jgi:divalent metal cation (Fe/Co/Zn/Cd) transporter
VSWRIALREFRAQKGKLGYFAAVERSKDPTTFMVLFEDSAALLGLLIAFVGIFVAHTFDMPRLDGAASIGIGCVLAVTAIVLARESKGLLIGEPALKSVQEAILKIAASDPAVQRANGVITVHLGPHQIVVALSAEFDDRLTAPEIEACVERLEAKLRAERPEIVALFVKPQTSGTWAEHWHRLDGNS